MSKCGKTALLVFAVIITVSWLPGKSFAQHHHGPSQKGEGDNESAPLNGGFQAPPRAGVQEGATGGVRINGPVLEIPAIKLNLPNLSFPGMTRLRTPAQMLIKEAIAPFVQNVRNEVSFETSAVNESAPLADGTNETAPVQRPEKPIQQNETGLQKVSLEQARLESRVRELEVLLTQVERKTLNSGSELPQGGLRRVPSTRPAEISRQQPHPLPTVYETRPASYEMLASRASDLAPSDSPGISMQRDADHRITELFALTMELRQQQAQVIKLLSNHADDSSQQLPSEVRSKRLTRLPQVIR